MFFWQIMITLRFCESQNSLPINMTTNGATAIAVQPDGKIFMVGRAIAHLLLDLAIACYNADGTLHDNCGNKGV